MNIGYVLAFGLKVIMQIKEFKEYENDKRSKKGEKIAFEQKNKRK